MEKQTGLGIEACQELPWLLTTGDISSLRVLIAGRFPQHVVCIALLIRVFRANCLGLDGQQVCSSLGGPFLPLGAFLSCLECFVCG